MASKRIIVGVDGSVESKRALEFAIELASSFNAHLIACHVIGKLTRAAEIGSADLDQYRTSVVQTFEEEWCKALDESGLRSQKITVDGNPVSSLMTIAEEEHADLLVLGSRRHTIESYLGSTSHHLIEHSPIPVVVVPPKSS